MKKAGLTAILCLLVCVLSAGLLSCGDKETQTEQTRETTQTEPISQDTPTDTDSETVADSQPDSQTNSQTEPEDMDSFWTPIV